jgi:acetyl-CoA acetyltransferase
MMRNLLADRGAYVAGIGLHRYQRRSDESYVELGLEAVRAALGDAFGDPVAAWPSVDVAITGTALLGMAPSRVMLARLGASGLAIHQVENASASGSTAVAQAALSVSSGQTDVALAIGLDKPEPWRVAAASAGIPSLEGGLVAPFTHFALLASRYQREFGVSDEEIARVAVKNHRNGAKNPYAHRQKERSMEEIMQDPISGSLTRLQCCPVGEGAAAVVVASAEAIEKFGLDPARCPRIIGSASRSQGFLEPGADADSALTIDTARRVFEQAGLGPSDIDVLEVHDAFSVEELFYLEAMGFCGPGESAKLLAEGAWDVGGRCAVSASGGLLAMGHPLGPTGTGQIVEIARQLRGEAGARQQPDARYGVAHMVGLGAVCVMHVLERGKA